MAHHMTLTQTCSTCGKSHPLNRDHFGSTPSGGFRKKCRQCMAAYSKEYAKNNPKEQSGRNSQRIARGGHVETDLSLKQRLLQRQNNYCLCCGGPIEIGQPLELDHVNPVAKGGTHDTTNFAIAHKQCNAEKHAKTLEEHWLWRMQRNLTVKKFRMLASGFWEPI